MSKQNAPNSKFPWQRYWRLGDGKWAGDGYFPDPEDPIAKYQVPEAVKLSELDGVACLVLLGEPGSGKSVELKGELERLAQQARDLNIAAPEFCDLLGYGNEDRMCRDLFERRQVEKWRIDNENLTLLLDSFDECLMRLDNLMSILIREFRRGPSDKLRIRICCRSAAWQATYSERLRNIFLDNFRVLHLAPLRKKDVFVAVENILGPTDVQPFINRVRHDGVEALATAPVTLDLLLRLSRQQQFPSQVADLYSYGCEILCSEQGARADGLMAMNPISLERTGRHKVTLRIQIASWIAVLSVFCRRTGIYYGDPPPLHQEADTCLTMADLQFSPVSFNADTVLETLSTGLFLNNHNQSIATWRHRSFCEYLAARQIVQLKLPISNVLDLLFHPEEEALVPQLEGVASWLSSMSVEIADALFERAPLVVLRNSNLDPIRRQGLIEHILKGVSTSRLLIDTVFREHYDRLSHATLSQQLHLWISNPKHNERARFEAIAIARACKVHELEGLLCNISLDQNESLAIRSIATSTLADLELTQQARTSLVHLARGVPEDVEDELKGAALRALWPASLSTKTLLSFLTTPKRENYYGSYRYFADYIIPKNIAKLDLAHALDWIATNPAECTHEGLSQDLGDAIMRHAWNLLDPLIAPPFARAAISRLNFHSNLFGSHSGLSSKKFEVILINPHKRRLFLAAFVDVVESDSSVTYWSLIGHKPALIAAEDVPWLLEKLKDERSKSSKERWAGLVEACVYSFYGLRDDIENAAEQVPELWTKIGKHINLKKTAALHQSTTKATAREDISNSDVPKPITGEEYTARLRHYLTEFFLPTEHETRHFHTWWWSILVCLSVGSKERGHVSDLVPDLTTLPGWPTAAGEQSQLLNIAKHYLLEFPEGSLTPWSQWLGTNTLNRPWLGGYRALNLVMKLSPEWLNDQSAGFWCKWTPIIIGFPHNSGFDWSQGEHVRLVLLAYRNAREPFLSSLKALILSEDANHSYLFCLRQLFLSWDSDLASYLIDLSKEIILKPGSLNSLFSELLSHAPEVSIDYVYSLVVPDANQDTLIWEFSLVAASQLLHHCSADVFPKLFSLFQQYPAFGRAVMLKVASDGDRFYSQLGTHLGESELAQLYLWLCDHFPATEDPQFEGVHAVGAREAVAALRDGLLAQLQNAGTRAAYQAVAWIAQQRKEWAWLNNVLLAAKQRYRAQSWEPYTPLELYRLLSKDPLGGSELNLDDTRPNIGVAVNAMLDQPKTSSGIRIQLSRIFSHRGAIPEHTYVAPREHEELVQLLRGDHVAIFIYGPSGIGKSTAVTNAIRTMVADERPQPKESELVERINCADIRQEADVISLIASIKNQHSTIRYYVFDDFHRMPKIPRSLVTGLIKPLIESGNFNKKIIMISILPFNELDHPDISWRIDKLQILRQPDELMEKMISLGEKVSNIKFRCRISIIAEAKGSFALAQWLCYEAARLARLYESQAQECWVETTADALVSHLTASLHGEFQPLVCRLSMLDLAGTRGAGLCVLWCLAHAENREISIPSVKAKYPRLQAEITCLEKHLEDYCRGSGGIMNYSAASKTLRVDEFRLEFYLRHLKWIEVLEICELKEYIGDVDLIDGPLLASKTTENSAVHASSISVALKEPNMTSSRILDLLKLRLGQARLSKNGSVFVVAGTGVSIQATNRAPVASWGGLLHSGLEVCKQKSRNWKKKTFNAASIESMLSSNKVADWISAATIIERTLRGAGKSVYANWLKDVLGTLTPIQPEILKAIGALGVPILTTNYDGLLEHELGLQPMTWRTHALVDQLISGTFPAGVVLHLHGHFAEHQSVVLGATSYDKILSDKKAQDTLRNILRNHDLLFVGVGGGLEDPNFGALLDWAKDVTLPESRYHFLLLKEKDAREFRPKLPVTTGIHVIEYGRDHDELVPFLKNLLTSPP